MVKTIALHESDHKSSRIRKSKAATIMASPSMSYTLPFDLFNPDLSNERIRAKYFICYQVYYQLLAFFAVTKTKKNDKRKLSELMEESFNNAVNRCPHLSDQAMKQKLKAEMQGQGEKAFDGAKAHKRQSISWTALMKPHEPCPSGSPQKRKHLITKLLNVLWKEHKNKNKKKFQQEERPTNFEPSKLWSTYIHLELWEHPKCKPPTLSRGDDSLDSEEEQQQKTLIHRHLAQRAAERRTECQQSL